MQVSGNEIIHDAVVIRKGFKAYKTFKTTGVRESPVLHNFNMTVKEGTIYGLLGASGCGKTTVLNCIIGKHKLNNGDISVFGYQAGHKDLGIPGRRVGYMPQETALIMTFTIQEMAKYFGLIYGLSSSEILIRTQFILKLLDLPPKRRIIGTLSGGQQRRVSFAMALIHEPELLILDEPTVGLDPLLRQRIWSHLKDLTNSKKHTIIITTHYIEEAKQAHVTGMMRCGSLLAEENPVKLMEIHHVPTMEDVFLHLCMGKESEDSDGSFNTVADVNFGSDFSSTTDSTLQLVDDNNQVLPVHFKAFIGNESDLNKDHNASPGSVKKPWVSKNKNIILLKRIHGLLYKRLLWISRDYGALVAATVLPGFVLFMICLAIGRDPKNVKVGIINSEFPDDPFCQTYDGCLFLNLSCRFINELDKKDLNLITYDNPQSALAAVEAGQLWAYIQFPANYSQHLEERVLLSTDKFLSDGLTNKTLTGSTIRMRIDMSNIQLTVLVQRMILFKFFDYLTKLMNDCYIDTRFAELPLDFSDPVYGSDKTEVMNIMAPGVALIMLFVFPLASTTIAFVVERLDGMTIRNWVAGVQEWEKLIVHLLVEYFIIVGQIAICIFVMIVIFQIDFKGSVMAFSVLLMLQGAAGISIGILASSLFDNVIPAARFGIAVAQVAIFFSGTVWPIEGMPDIFRYISTYLPLALPCESLRSIAFRAWGVLHPGVWPGFLVSGLWTIGCFLLAIFVLRFRKDTVL